MTTPTQWIGLAIFIAGCLCIAAGIFFVVRDSRAAPVQWEHGYRTDYVIATRYRNPHMGYNIGFRFPKHLYDSDRLETSEFLKANGCHIYQGGGYPGAELFCICDGVKDPETANAKLVTLVPLLDAHIRSLR